MVIVSVTISENLFNDILYFFLAQKFVFSTFSEFVNFSKMVVDTGFKVSRYINFLMGYRMIYQTLL